MTSSCRVLALLAPLLVAATAAVGVTGHAATLGVASAKLDTFAADQAAPTTTAQTGPVLVDVTDSDGSGGANDGLPQAGDWIELHVSAPLDPTTLPQTVAVSILDDPGSTPETLSMTGVLSGPASLGSDGYVERNNRTVIFTASAVTLTGAGQRIRVTLGSCTGSCSDLRKSSGTTTFTLASTVKGADGVPVTGSVTKTGFSLF